MIVTFSEQDIRTSVLVKPSWYLVQIDEVNDRSSNDQQSVNSWLKGHIIKDDDTGSVEHAGVPTPYLWLINSKGAFAGVGLFNAVFGEEVKANDRRDTAALAGKKVVAFIGNDLYKNAMVNVITQQYRQPKPEDR